MIKPKELQHTKVQKYGKRIKGPVLTSTKISGPGTSAGWLRHPFAVICPGLLYICIVHLYLLCSFRSERLRYVGDILFSRLMGLTWEQVDQPEQATQSDAWLISYGNPIPGVVSIPSCGLLQGTNLPQTPPPLFPNSDLPGLFPHSESGYAIPFDLLATAFWLLTDGWELQGSIPKDVYGRSDNRQHPLVLNGWVNRPLVEDYAHFLQSKFSREPLPEKPFSFRITLDIDEPWKHAHKPLWVQGGGLIKSLLHRDWGAVQERLRSLTGGPDPFYVFPELQDPNQILLFFLIDRHDPKDGRHTWRNPSYRNLIRWCVSQGFEIGIHPSYTSSTTPGRIQYEKERLEDITGQAIVHSRQHFLRYQNPKTFQELEACGIQHEYSICPTAANGYMRGMARPFPWYDLEQERMTGLMLHPVMVMDRALQKYQGHSAETAWDVIRTSAENTRQYGGAFVILWHNATLSETGEWRGWKKVWRQVEHYSREVNAC